MATKLGKELVKIDRWEPTTQICHVCNHREDAAQYADLRVRRLRERGRSRRERGTQILEAGRSLRSGATRKTSQEASGAITAESHRL